MNPIERHYEQLGSNFRAVWDFYMKYHIVFLVFNLSALGLVFRLVPLDQRKPVFLAFIFQNLISGLTALGIAAYSAHCGRQQDAMMKLLRNAPAPSDQTTALALSSVVPVKLAMWAGFANAAAHLVFIGCWIAAW
jgi:cytochrome bd-type quinol oxidase subunit 1